MKKILVYSAVAVVLGLILTLVPLFMLVEFKAEKHYDAMLYLRSLPEQMEKLEGAYDLGAPKYSAVDLEIFAISFAIALVVYVLFKRRISPYD